MLPQQSLISEDFYPKWLNPLLFCFLALIAVLQVLMVFRFEINWDEFFLLDWVYKWNSGELNLVLQTIYFRAFTWLPAISDNEVTQIVAARLVMLACLGVSASFIYGICRKFTSRIPALLSLIMFLTMTFVFRNATSFRTDMLVTVVLMGVLWCLMVPVLTWKRVLVSGFSLGLAGMITIKAILYAPIIATILLAHWGNSKWQFSIFLKSVAIGGIAILSFTSLYILHSLDIDSSLSSATYISHSINGSLFEAGLFPQKRALIAALIANPVVFSILLIGIFCSLLKMRQPSNHWAYFVALSYVFPFLTIVFYRHTHPYFYTFMLAPATLLLAIGLNSSWLKKKVAVTIGIIAALFISTTSTTIKSLSQNLDTQKQVLTIIHELFPNPTPYIDRCAMIASYPKFGLFMSQWVMGDYYKTNKGIMKDILISNQPKFILANIGGLKLDKITTNTDRRLLKADEELLQDNYIPHWGPVYVAGKTVQINGGKPIDFQIYIAGHYGVEAMYPLEINGSTYQSGDIINLQQGVQNLSSRKTQTLTLRWNKLEYPNTSPPQKKLFHGFYAID